MIPSDGIINSIKVSITLGGEDILNVTSDGCSNFHVEGSRLRWGSEDVRVTEYADGRKTIRYGDYVRVPGGRIGDVVFTRAYTTDDLAVMGQIVHQLGALFSMEVLKTRLEQHDSRILESDTEGKES
jgi:hypothetical protein